MEVPFTNDAKELHSLQDDTLFHTEHYHTKTKDSPNQGTEATLIRSTKIF